MCSKERLIKNISSIHGKCKTAPESPDKLYHYTSVEGVYNIIKNKCFWITKSDFLNDEKELIYFYRILEEVLKENKFNNIDLEFVNWFEDGVSKKLEYTFILSFSKEGDSLPLWEMYPGGRGYNIELNYEKFFQAFLDGKIYISTVDNKKIYLTRKNDSKQIFAVSSFVIYDRVLQKNMVKELLKGIDLSIEFMKKYHKETELNMVRDMHDRILSEFMNYMMIFKDESFSYEGEYREVYNIIDCDQLDIIRHKVKDGRIIPYIELVVEENVIDAVTISPRLKEDILSIKGLESFINTINKGNDSNQIMISHSKSSIR